LQFESLVVGSWINMHITLNLPLHHKRDKQQLLDHTGKARARRCDETWQRHSLRLPALLQRDCPQNSLAFSNA
jgi:hypothetical protein